MMPNGTLEPELYEVASGGDIRRLEKFLRPNVENQEQTEVETINITNGFPTDWITARCLSGVTYAGDTALHIAAHFGQIEVAKRICQESRSLLTRGNTKLETPLHYAAQAGKLGVVNLFIQLAREDGSNINLDELLRKRNRDGETALYQAVHHEHNEVAEKLMSEDDNLASIPDRQNTSPLYLATMLRSLPIVITLVQLLPQDVSQAAYAGPDGQTALHAAALRNEGFVQKIMNWKPDITRARDNSGRTPLHYAASAGNPAAVRILLQKERNSAYIADSCGSFPVHDAAKLGHLEVLVEIFKQCPDSDELLDGQGKKFFHLAVEEKRVSVVQWVCENIKLEKAMNEQDNQGNTPLHLAVKAKDTTTFAYLILSKRVHLNWANRDGLTPLDIACAQVKEDNPFLVNPEGVILEALVKIGCSHGTNRANEGNNRDNDQEMEQKEVKIIEQRAQSIVVGSVLIASAAFAAAFAVSQACLNDFNKEEHSDDTPGVEVGSALESFIAMDACAFLYSMTATFSIIQGTSQFMDPKYRKQYLQDSMNLTMWAAKFLFGAFVSGIYFLLAPAPESVMFMLYTFGITGPLFIQPPRWLYWQDRLVARAIAKHIGWKELIIGKTNTALYKRIQSIAPLYYSGHMVYVCTLLISLWPWTTGIFGLIFGGILNTILTVLASIITTRYIFTHLRKEKND